MTPTLALAPDRLPATPPIRRSRLLATLTTPWRSTKRQTLWIALVIFVLGCAAAVVSGILVPDARGQAFAMIFYAAGVCFVWAFWFSGLLLVARDARMLGIPGVARDTVFCALVYGVLMIAAPALIEGAFGWNVALPAMLSAFAIAGSLTFVLAPRWVSACMGFLPGVYSTTHAVFHVLSPLGRDFLHWGTAATVALLLLVVIRWRHVLLDDSAEACGWSSPMVLQLRQQAVSAGWSFDKQMLWRRNGSQHRYTDLRGIDASTPAKTIEVALGALFVPQTMAGNLRRLAMVAWPILIFVVAMLLSNFGRVHDLRKLLVIIGVSGALWSGAFGMGMLLFAVTALLKRRWEQGAEPALLALLPGLGRHAPMHRSVLRAAFVKPFALCIALWAMMIACEYLLHVGTLAYLLTTLIVVGVLAPTALSLLRLFSGRPLGTFAQTCIIIATFVLMGVTLPLAYLTPMAKLGPVAGLIEWSLLAAWLVFAAWMTLLALHAWRAFHLRPHPFLSR